MVFLSIIYSLTFLILITKYELIATCRDPAWHIATGHFILENGLPGRDPWSFGSEGQAWMNVSWLWDVFIALAHGVFSDFYLPVVINVTIAALAFSVLGALVLKRSGSIPLAIVVLTLGLIPFSFGLALRPQQLSFLFAVLFYFKITSFFERQDLRELLLLPGLMLVWVNSHGAFLAGFLVFGAFFFEVLRSGKKQVISYLAFVLLTGLVVFLNPYGASIFEALQRTLDSPFNPYISEWLPTSFSREFLAYNLYFYLFFLLSPVILLSKKIRVAEKLLSFAWLFQAITHQRHMTFFVIFSAPAMTIALVQVLPWVSKAVAEFFEHKHRQMAADFQSPGALKGSAIVCFLVLLTFYSGLARPLMPIELGSRGEPVEEINYFVKHLPDKRVLNDYFYGGCIIYLGQGKLKHFVDGRCETALPREVMEEYISFLQCEDGWEKIVSKYGIESALLPNNSPALDCFQNKFDWPVVYQGEVASVLLR